MPSYFINQTDLDAAQEKQSQLCRWYLEGRTVVPQPEHTRQGPLKAFKYAHNLQVVARYLLENLNSHVSIFYRFAESLYHFPQFPAEMYSTYTRRTIGDV